MFKRTVKLLTLTALMFIGGNSFAQQNQWEDKDIQTINNEYLMPAAYCEGISYSTDNGVLKIYNSNFECIKTVSLFPNTSDVQNKYLRVYCLTKGVFTNSNKYEFVAVGDYDNGDVSEDEYKYTSISGIYNEDGTLLYKFDLDIENGSDDNMQDDPYILGNKLVIKCYKYDRDDASKRYTKIYTLANSVTSGITQVQQQNQPKLYPNPAKQSVTVEYDIQGQMQKMQIMDMQGRVVADYLLDPSQQQIKINTSDYKKGVYVYRYGNHSGKFIVR